ncbi:membrane-bound lytic murein transglycosylase MltC [Psychromonas aquimarina]|uniref:membrane-bound lytic murein transglycosylase MltC n=1 Tax=Psychromonas aquimarina TaxID=444919 RepID=UPI00041CB9E2|nr:membrane-bound lytic murein transglycosylase MltC [Psychromonas aquimarina]
MKRLTAIISGVLLLTACTETNRYGFTQEETKKRIEYYKNNPDEIEKDVRSALVLFSNLEKKIDDIWGEKEMQLPEKKKYVKYTNHYQDRAYIDFDKGIVRVETIAEYSSLTHLKSAIVTTLLTPDSPNEVDVFSSKEIPVLNKEPFLYKQILDEDKQPIRWQWRAERYAQNLIDNKLQTKQSGNKKIYSVEFNLVKNSEEIRSYKYSTLVQQASKRYNIKESLIYAIIKTESSFNPYAVSHANAYGLMQVIPKTAGKDVFQKIKKRDDQPTKAYLFSPENNIDTGTAYLQILKTRYLKGINNDTGRHYAMISAYNGGAGNVFKTFHTDRTQAVKVMNNKNSQQIYDNLTTRNPIAEARRYLYKVNKYEKEFIHSWQE